MLIALLIVIGICMLICGIIFRPIRTITVFSKKEVKGGKTILGLLENITSRRMIQKPLDFMSRDKKLLTNKLTSRILELSEAGISLQQMYFLKIICLTLCTLLMLIVRYTNITYQVKLIVESSEGEKAVLYQDNSYTQSRYKLYKQVMAGVGRNKLAKASIADKYLLIEEEMAARLNTSDNQILEEKTEWFIKTLEEVEGVRVFKYYHILLMFLAPFLPELLLTLRWLLRGSVYKKEIIKLEYIFGLLAQVDGIKTLDIIHELEKSSRIYAKYLHEFATIFQYDKKRSFDYLKNRNIKSLTKLTNILEIYSLSDKAIALQVLEREVMERDESIIITADETMDFIDLVAFLSIVPMVYELVRLMLNPMLDIVYKAFEFI